MKKKNVINLIKYYSEKNDKAFRDEAYEIAKDGDIKFSLPIIVFSVLCVVFGIFSSGLIEVIKSLVSL